MLRTIGKLEDEIGPQCYAQRTMQGNHIAKHLLITELVVIFAYFGVDKFVSPILWIGWIPLWMDGLLGMPKELWLHIIGAFEIITALLILVPFRRARQIGTILAAGQLVGIFTQVGVNDVGARDLAILLSDLALMAML